MSIKTKLTLIFVGLIVAVVIPSSISLLLFFRNALREENELILKNHANNIDTLIQENHLLQQEELALTIDLSDDIIYQLLDDEGKLIIGSPYAGQTKLDLSQLRSVGWQEKFQEIKINGTPFQITFHNVVKNSAKGSLIVGINYSRMQEAERELLVTVLGIDVLASFIAGILCWSLIISQFNELRRIVDFAKSDIVNKNLSLRFPLPERANVETRELIIAVNQGLEKIEKMFISQKQFLADVSHELRTPLTVLKGNVGLMRRMSTFDHESLLTMEREIDRLNRLVNELLLFMQADSETIALDMTCFDLDELFIEVYEQLKILAGKKYKIDLVEIEQAKILGDKDRIKQVMLNLGGNALKFTPPNGIIRIGLISKDDKAMFYFSDNGPGISPQDLEHIFERLYQGQNLATSTVAADRGYGIGLAISDWIIKKHEGEIIVNSKEGEGSTFSVYLPLAS